MLKNFAAFFQIIHQPNANLLQEIIFESVFRKLIRNFFSTKRKIIKMTKLVKLACFLFAVLILTSPVLAQRRPTAKPGATPVQTAKERAQRLADEESVRNMKDFGFDGAVIIKDTAIRETAAPAGKILLSVKRGNILSLVVREADRNWYNVVEADSGTEGWVNGKDVIIKLTDNTENTGPPLEEEEAAAANVPPEVSISNLEEKTTLRIRLNGKLHLIAPGTTKVVQMPAGNFKYYGWSPGIRPTRGSRILEKGKKYSWQFRIYRR